MAKYADALKAAKAAAEFFVEEFQWRFDDLAACRAATVATHYHMDVDILDAIYRTLKNDRQP